MRRFGHGVHHRQEALGQLVGFALADLIGLHRDEGVVASFGLHRHGNASDRAGELPPPGLLLHLGQGPPEVAGRGGKDLVGWKMGAVKVFHAVGRSRSSRLIILIVLGVEVGDLLLSHQVPERVLELDLLNEKVVLRIQARRRLRALEVE